MAMDRIHTVRDARFKAGRSIQGIYMLEYHVLNWTLHTIGTGEFCVVIVTRCKVSKLQTGIYYFKTAWVSLDTNRDQI